MDEEVVRAALRHYIHYSAAGDEDRASEIYHEDAVVEFPQSGERFEGSRASRTSASGGGSTRRRSSWRSSACGAGPTSGSRRCGVVTTMDRGTTAPPSMSFAATRLSRETIYVGEAWGLRSGVPGGEPRLPVSQRAASPGSRRRTRAVPNGSAGRVLVRVRSPPPFGLPERAQPDRKAGHRSTRSSCANRSAAPVPAQLVSDRVGRGYTQNSEVLPDRHAARLDGASHQGIEIVGLAQWQRDPANLLDDVRGRAPDNHGGTAAPAETGVVEGIEGMFPAPP